MSNYTYKISCVLMALIHFAGVTLSLWLIWPWSLSLSLAKSLRFRKGEFKDYVSLPGFNYSKLY